MRRDHGTEVCCGRERTGRAQSPRPRSGPPVGPHLRELLYSDKLVLVSNDSFKINVLVKNCHLQHIHDNVPDLILTADLKFKISGTMLTRASLANPRELS